VLTEEFKVVLPALAAIAPELPQTSKRAVEALDEAVVLMKALQRSFFVKGNAEKVRKEEQKRSQDSRLPAGE
jgi:phospholipid/cholesterol/gamma-HCH transport system substrate-binding protein